MPTALDYPTQPYRSQKKVNLQSATDANANIGNISIHRIGGSLTMADETPRKEPGTHLVEVCRAENSIARISSRTPSRMPGSQLTSRVKRCPPRKLFPCGGLLLAFLSTPPTRNEPQKSFVNWRRLAESGTLAMPIDVHLAIDSQSGLRCVHSARLLREHRRNPRGFLALSHCQVNC